MIYKDFYGQRANNIRVRDEVARRYMRPEHIGRIENHFRKVTSLHFFSVRPAGVDTLNKLGRGAAPKPHSILEKSIKGEEYDFLYYLYHDSANKELAAYEQQAREALCGLVAHREDFSFIYEEDGKQKTGTVRIIRGLYLSSAGERHFVGLPAFSVSRDRKNRAYVVFDGSIDLLDWVHQVLATADSGENFETWFVTGDYDLHDLVEQVGSGVNPYVSDSGDEATALLQLGNIIAGKSAGSPVLTFTPDEMSLIQHGPQYNYIAHTFDKEKNHEIVEKVADLSLEIALYDGKDWVIIENDPSDTEAFKKQSRELKSYYDDHHAKLKWTWDRSNPDAKKYITHISGKKLADIVRSQMNM